MAKTAHPTPSMTAGEVSAPSSPNLLAERRSHSNGHGSPARLASAGKTTPANTEKKPQLNGHPSPLHPPAGTGNLPGTPYAEGSTKTDDRMRLAKERREERERSLAAREQVIREKERRAQLQYERTVEERWRRLDEQRQKEELRRAAVEEKRRQQLEDDKERLEALMKRSLERSLQLEQRARRWTRGPGAAGAGDSQHAPPPLCAASSAFPHGIASPLPASSESAPCSPHRSPYRGTLNPADHNRTGLHGGSQSTPNTPKKERLRRERRTASPACGSSPARRAGSPAGGSKYFTSASPSTPKLASKIRPQSPCALGGYRSSPPARRRPVPSADDTSGGGRGDVDRVDGQREGSKVKSCVKRRSNIHRPDSPSPTEKSAEKEHVVNVETGRNTSTEILDKGSPTGKAVAGTTNAEEASRLLAERRRQARVQKEMEEKKQQQEKEERLKAEQLKVNLSREHQRQEQVQENVREDPHRAKDGDGEQRREGKEKERESQTERETEKGKAPAEEDTERQRQDRELQKLQEEEERQVRKKRIEEIMKRTRKGDADFKEGQTEARSVSLPGELRMNVQTSELVSERAVQNAFQVDERVAAQGFEKEDAPKKEVKREVVEQRDVLRCAQLKNGTQQKTSSPQESEVEKGAQVAKISRNDNIVELQETPAGMQVNKRDGVPETSLAKCVDAGSNPPEGVVMNGQRRNQNGQPHAEAGRQKSLRVPGRPEPVAGGASPAPPSAERPSVPVVKLELLDVKGSSSVDEVQSMDISPASKEELISIPKFPPVNDVRLNSVSGGRALEDLLDLTGGVACPKTPGSESNADDCNKNLIGGVVSPILDSSHPYVFSVRK